MIWIKSNWRINWRNAWILTATLVVETVIEDNSLKVKRELESGWFQWVSFPLPASISIQSGLNSPRYPSLKRDQWVKKEKRLR